MTDRGSEKDQHSGVDAGLATRVAVGFLVVFLTIGGVGGWAATAELSGAVIGSGVIVVDSNIKKVQHPTGGVVGELLVSNGQAVTAGQLLVRLDDTQTRAALGIVVSQLIELTGRRARLAAERDDAVAIAFPAEFEASGEEARRVASGERRLFEAKRRTMEGQKAQLRERIGQLSQEIEGLSAQRKSKEQEIRLVNDELARVEDMYKRKLTPVTRLLAMQRDASRIEGEHGALVAQIARARGQITETELQILSLDHTARTEAQKELREIEGRLAELAERKVAAEDQLKRVDIRAPRSGIVHDLGVHTVGGVVAAAEPMMHIVPSEDVLTIEARIGATDIDQLSLGQPAVLRFPAFNQRTTPELPGTVVRVAADLTREASTGQSFYIVRIQVDEAALGKLKGLKLVPGMPVEAFIETGQRTALSYLIKPFTDQLTKALRED